MQTKTLLATIDSAAGNTSYNFPFLYLRKEFVKVMRLHTNDTRTILNYHADYEVENNVVMLAEAGDPTDTIRIYRETPTEQIIAEYVDASILKAYDLNVRDIQLLHILEEAMDFVNLYALLLDPADNCWDALSRRLKNLADPVDPQDATTKKYVNEEDEKIMTFIRRYCMLLDEAADKWEARHKAIMHVEEPTEADHATNKQYVDRKIQELDTALRQLISELESVLRELITALSERVSVCEQAIQSLETRMQAAEQAIAILQASGGGGGGGLTLEDVLNAILVKTPYPTLIEVMHYGGGGGHEQWNANFSYDYENVTMSGTTFANTAGTYTVTFTLRPLYCWPDGSREPYEMQWTAEAEAAQQLSLSTITHELKDGTTHIQEMHDATDVAPDMTFDGSPSNSDWLTAPKKTYTFSATAPYTALTVEYLNRTYSTGDTFTTAWENNGVPQNTFSITVGYDYIIVEGIGNSMNEYSNDYLTVKADNKSPIQFGLHAVNCSPKQVTLLRDTVMGTDHDFAANTTSASIAMDKTYDGSDTDNWAAWHDHNIYVNVSADYTTLKCKCIETGEVASNESGDVDMTLSNYPSMRVSVNKASRYNSGDNVGFMALAGGSDPIGRTYLIYADDDEEHGATITITKVNYPTPLMIPEADYTYVDDSKVDSYSGNTIVYTRPCLKNGTLEAQMPTLAEIEANWNANSDYNYPISNYRLTSNPYVIKNSSYGVNIFDVKAAQGYILYDPNEYEKYINESGAAHIRWELLHTPTLTLISQHPQGAAHVPELYYGGPDAILEYSTDSTGEVMVELEENLTNPYLNGIDMSFEPTYTIDQVTKRITVRLTRSTWSVRSDYNETKPMAMKYTNSLHTLRVKVRTADTGWAVYELMACPGDRVIYSDRADADAAYYNGGQEVILPLIKYGDGAIVDNEARKATTPGTYTMQYTLTNGEAWFDGSTQSPRSFTWTLHKYCPLALDGSFQGYSNSAGAPTQGYNYSTVLTLTRNGRALGPAPTFTTYPAQYADKFEITPIDSWGSKNQPTFKLTAKNTEAIDEDVYLKVMFDEGTDTSDYVHYIPLGSHFAGKDTAGYVSILTSSTTLAGGEYTTNTAVEIKHGEIPALADISVAMADPSICSVEVVDLIQQNVNESYYYLKLKFTPLQTGNTNLTITIPETEHYREIIETKIFRVL